MKFRTFLEDLNEATLAAPRLRDNPERIRKIEDKMVNNEPFKMHKTEDLIFPWSPHNHSEIERLYNHKSGDKYSFEDINGAFHSLSAFEKTKEFGSNKSLNSEGQKLTDAGERATILSFSKNIETADDTGEEIFLKNANAFNRWKKSFKLTKIALESVLGNNFGNKFEFIHDATSNSNFSSIISRFCKKIKISKNSWNPADVWIIKKGESTKIEQKLNNIVEKYSGDNLLKLFNSKIYELYLGEKLIPVSLKQITSNKAKIEYNNKPNEKIPSYNIKINKFVTNLKMDSVEIGTFSFINNSTKAKIIFQTKGYPHSSDSTQTEITKDGSKTGGRLGKVPAQIISKIYDKFGYEKIKPAKYFNKKIENTKISQIKEWVKYYKFVSNSSYSEATIPPNKIQDHLIKTINEIKDSSENTKTFKHKIQGLYMQYFLIKEEKNISEILTNYILGAKKINTGASFFIKVY